MKIARNTVASLDFRLHLSTGELVEESTPDDPLHYLHGAEQIVPGLERALEGKSVGDKLKVVVSPEDGYGEYDPDAVQEVPKSELPEDLPLEKDEVLFAEDDDGEEMEFVIKEVKKDTVVLDANHPLAGKTLHFDITVREIRAATKEELEHGHSHAPGHEH